MERELKVQVDGQTYYDNIGKLEAGDRVVVRFGNHTVRVVEVERVTNTLIIVNHNGEQLRFRKDDGRMFGQHSSYYEPHLAQAYSGTGVYFHTSESWAEVERAENELKDRRFKIRKLGAFLSNRGDSLAYKLTASEIQQLAEILGADLSD